MRVSQARRIELRNTTAFVTQTSLFASFLVRNDNEGRQFLTKERNSENKLDFLLFFTKCYILNEKIGVF